MKANKLDKFYTNPSIISKLIENVDWILKASGYGYDINWIEPSAGSGNFIHSLHKNFYKVKVQAFDIEPHFNNKIIKANFLEIKPKYKPNNVVIGNPPFGKRADLAIKFINQSFLWADVVAFILPNQFQRYLTQNKISKNALLIHQSKIAEDSFLVNDKPYNVNCIFQIWVNGDREEFKEFKNLRITKKPEIKHKDFETYIYNNTNETKKYFNKEIYKWDIAIPRQGYYNYNNLIKDDKKLKSNVQYFFVKYKSNNAEEIIKNIDFDKLSKKNTTIPGFSTVDFINEYKKMKKKKRKI
ncbi:SAM-dependent methyltransferase [Mesoplasma coleopterae]|uniref:SAM-dependent methyltransferase n=1 Tax=Mesoplasma coleopterae TaxID=324078 RepID=UPI000D0288EA|nr:SAM-dependent methyltransferase [Mesoplasma coleopterae]AVN63008.1 SAM-dependent methyltransferase [Mesoplasma coleopterae]